jgi:cell division protein YceG involved in septum cleavage
MKTDSIFKFMRRHFIRIFIAVAVAFAIGLATGSNLLFTGQAPPEAVIFEIRPGDSLSTVARGLEERQVIRYALSLKLLSRWQQNGDKA